MALPEVVFSFSVQAVVVVLSSTCPPRLLITQVKSVDVVRAETDGGPTIVGYVELFLDLNTGDDGCH